MTNVYDSQGNASGETTLSEKLFGIEPNTHVMHLHLVRQLANLRAGTASTLTRSEVSGGGRKPWKQKGTGRARVGSTRSPLWKGGGVIFGPQPHSYEKDMPRKMRRLALRSALSAKAEAVMVMDEWKIDKPSTKNLQALLNKMGATGKVLLLISEHDSSLELSASNLPTVKSLLATNLNVKDLLNCDKIVATTAALHKMEEVFAQ
ncbi:MAG TPA: 50S ribosomal protein L4 [Cyanobacteria bacterium UBA8530]|nr:50S ribosomal protein L4 [Cyanobacteria bacterium UBA8530]